MENFNKNWLIILLVAVIFGTLGFLVGRTTAPNTLHKMAQFHSEDGNDFQLKVEVDALEDDSTVKIDTILKDGKQIIVKEVKKIKKQ
ncbi:MAG: hypothetical protein JNM78_17355 [Cyclobacteriaceae bacterium]|nr:hypothetical protein [Cyclobacteriaceae bacterium]